MIARRPSDARGRADHGWLDTRHTFSFADYFDAGFMGFRTLRVLNEDRVAPGQGFGTHSHRDMEIITVVLAGALEHEDSLGNGSILVPGEVQRMTAGTGVRHSEANPLPDEPVHFLQIWIIPSARGLAPSYEQRAFAEEELRDRLRLVASPDGAEGSVTVHQDARLFRAELSAGAALRHRFAPGRAGWLQVTRGALAANGVELSAGDGAAIEGEAAIALATAAGAGVLLFDLA
jgi:redox-sensitive bicupin YhaK (pirin superfamily)